MTKLYFQIWVVFHLSRLSYYTFYNIHEKGTAFQGRTFTHRLKMWQIFWVC